MGVIEFGLERTIKAPIEDVFARLADINGHNEWMPKKGSILRHTHQTSPGEPTLGTRFLDETVYGPTPGEIVEFHAPRTLVYHWWDSSKSGKLKAEGWPGYSLESADDIIVVVVVLLGFLGVLDRRLRPHISGTKIDTSAAGSRVALQHPRKLLEVDRQRSQHRHRPGP